MAAFRASDDEPQWNQLSKAASVCLIILNPSADPNSVLDVLVTMLAGKKFFFEPHLNLNQHDTEHKSKQRQSIWDHEKEL
jgi:hypothetical protein